MQSFRLPNEPLVVNKLFDEIAARLKDWRAPPARYTTGVFAKYAALVSSASEGAVTKARP